jgi:hypothetical protein
VCGFFFPSSILINYENTDKALALGKHWIYYLIQIIKGNKIKMNILKLRYLGLGFHKDFPNQQG